MRPTRLSDSEIGDLVRAFHSLDMDDWGEAAVARAIERLGWKRTRRIGRTGTVYDAGLSAGEASVWEDTQGGWWPEDDSYELLGYTVANAGFKPDAAGKSVLIEAFHATRMAAEELLGPAPILSGPGPLMRWRGPVSRLQIERESSRVELSLPSRMRVEAYEEWTIKWGEREHYAGAVGSWQAHRRDESLIGLLFPGSYEADDWDDFRDGLHSTLSALLDDIPRLAEIAFLVLLVPGDHTPCVQLAIGEPAPLRLEAASTAVGPEPLADLGWTEGPYNMTYDLPDASGKAAAIALACAGVFVAYLPVTTVAVSLPEIRRALGASTAQLSWVQDAFVLPVAALILTAGVFGDVHGRKKVYLAGMALCAAGALVALCAPSVQVLWAGQALAGAGAAALLPVTLALISQAVPDPDERGKYIGLWTTCMMGAMVVGPLIAGTLLPRVRGDRGRRRVVHAPPRRSRPSRWPW